MCIRDRGTWEGNWATFVVDGDSIFSLVAQYYGTDMDSSIVGFVVHKWDPYGDDKYVAYLLTFCGFNKVDTFTYECAYPLRLTLGKYSGHPVLIIERRGLHRIHVHVQDTITYGIRNPISTNGNV